MALIIGVFQMLALVPGTSRSGATIIGAILLGASRTAAAGFCFYLAVPVMAGASAVKLLKFDTGFTPGEFSALVLGMAVAFGVSVIVIRFLMDFIKSKSFAVFGWYRIALGTMVVLYFFVIR
jgi:undecaprenyl-diphosphatase